MNSNIGTAINFVIHLKDAILRGYCMCFGSRVSEKYRLAYARTAVNKDRATFQTASQEKTPPSPTQRNTNRSSTKKETHKGDSEKER